MAKKGRGKKVRVSFRQNRAQPRRAGDLTRRYHDDAERLADHQTSESVRAKGELSRKRTIRVDESDSPIVDSRSWLPARIIRIIGNICTLEHEDGRRWECTVRRVLRTLLIEQRSPVSVGDYVWFSDHSAYHDSDAVGVIERVEPRTTTLNRRERRGRAHAIVANAEQLLIVASVAEPALKPHLIDRYLVAAIQGDLRPIICFNKMDLLDDEVEEGDECEADYDDSGAEQGVAAEAGELEETEIDDYVLGVEETISEFAALGYRCLRTSAETGLGLQELSNELSGRTTVLSGQSGVGKSSLLNAIQPGLGLAVQSVSRDTEKGRHTTTFAQMFRLEIGGFVVDTPGIRQFELWNVEPGELESCFTEFHDLIASCRFKDCHHTEELDCAVRAAADAETISRRRYASYRKMLAELARKH